MKFLVEDIEYRDFDDENKAWWYVYFKDETGKDYFVEGYETSCGAVNSVDGTKDIPCELVDLCVSHFDPYADTWILEVNKYITITK